VTTCLFSSIVFLPALLSWLTRQRRDELPMEETAPVNVCLAPCPSPTVADPRMQSAIAVAESTVEPNNAATDSYVDAIEDEVAALVVAAAQPSAGRIDPPHDEVPIVPRRRAAPPAEALPAADNAPERGKSVLRHLASIRQSER
jgi:hypothetical protein